MSQSEVTYKSVSIPVDQSIGNFEAIALYDNQSETPDELYFKKGDILKVLEKDFNGLTGWWLCALKDKIGLAPGNRLEVIGAAPVKPQSFRKTDNSQQFKEKMNNISKSTHELYDVPKIVYSLKTDLQQQQQQQQHESEKEQEIPDILKGQNVNVQNNEILYTGPTTAKNATQLEETTNQKDRIYSGYDGYIWPDDFSLNSNPAKNHMYVNSSASNNETFTNGKNSHENNQSAPWSNGQTLSPNMNFSTYSNLQQPTAVQQISELLQPQFVYNNPVNGNSQQAIMNRNKRIIYSDSDNYDNLIAPLSLHVNGQTRSTKVNNDNGGTFIATTNNNMNKYGNGKSLSSVNIQYYDPHRDPGKYLTVKGSQTLQHSPRKLSDDTRMVVRDDCDLQMKCKNDAKDKRERSLRRVRFADEVTSSDTEEWTKNNDPFPSHNAVPLKPILCSSHQNRSVINSNPNNGQSLTCRSNVNAINKDDNNENGISHASDFTNRLNGQNYYQSIQADVPDNENPCADVINQPIYERPPVAYISTSSKLNFDNQNGKHPGKGYTSEFTTFLNTIDAGGNSQSENGNNSLYKSQLSANSVNQLHPQSLHKKFEGVFISSPTQSISSESEPEFQLRFLDLPKKEQDKILKPDDGLTKLSPELLNKSREKILILANSLDAILNRKNAGDAGNATVILKSIDVELQFLVNVGERGLKKSIETWNEDMIEALLQHLEDLRTTQGTLAILNKQIIELSRDTSNLQYCQTFDTICSSCALSGRNICYPVHQFVAYLLPKFKYLFPININDIGRLAPSPTFNNNPSSSFSSMTRNHIKGNVPESLGYASLKIAPVNLNVSKNLTTGRASSPIPKIESVPPYNANNNPKDAIYYEEIPYNQTSRQLSPNDSLFINKLDSRRVGHTKIPETWNNNATSAGVIRPGLNYSSLPSQILQGRPLPAPPSYSSVVGQASRVPLLARETTIQSNPLISQIQSQGFPKQLMAKDSPVINNNTNNIYSVLNGFNNDSA